MKEYVITAVGPDRPGLVDEFTEKLVPFQCNFGSSRMVNLGGRFALIAQVQVPEDQSDPMVNALSDIATGLEMTLQYQEVVNAPLRVEGVTWRIETYAMDQPGIVHQITRVLHQFGVNIEELDTNLQSGAHTGAPVFSMSLLASIPAGISISELKLKLNAICDEMNCDLVFKRG